MNRTITLCQDVNGIPSGTTLTGNGDVDLPSDWDTTEGPCVLWLETQEYGTLEIPLEAIEGAEILGARTDF